LCFTRRADVCVTTTTRDCATDITSREITSLHELPIALIEARIAARLTQRQLAERIGVAEQQVQRWEANDYSGVGLDRLQSIADALGVQIHETITYSSAA
jgi:HTH-type transcriptional regulator / antitoxin HipB